jgi:WS/DGAT C-terminal domain
MNIYVANVPGPPVPLYLAGALLLEVFPIVPIMGNVPLGIGALSYAGSSTSPWSRTGTAAQTPPSSPRDYRPHWTR